MTKTVLNVEGMMCEHCEQAVTKAVNGLSGISSVTVDLNAKTVIVEHDSTVMSVEKIKNEIEDQGYDVI